MTGHSLRFAAAMLRSFTPLLFALFEAQPPPRSSFLGVLNERLGSGDGERKTLLTRQIAFEPLPASVLFAWCLVADDLLMGSCEMTIPAEIRRNSLCK